MSVPTKTLTVMAIAYSPIAVGMANGGYLSAGGVLLTWLMATFVALLYYEPKAIASV